MLFVASCYTIDISGCCHRGQCRKNLIAKIVGECEYLAHLLLRNKMAPGSFIHTRSAFSVVWGMCFGITVTVLIIESGHFVDVNFSRTDRGSWRDEVRRYIARMKWTEDAGH